jgi:hypothetical protein
LSFPRAILRAEDDRIIWQLGDEFRCKACGAWHPTYLADPDETRYAANTVLHFVCPQSPGGYFYAGASARRSTRSTAGDGQPRVRDTCFDAIII